MKVFFDIETIPTQRADIIISLTQKANADLSRGLYKIAQKYKKPEVMAQHQEELTQELESAGRTMIEETSLNGLYGEVACICWSMDGAIGSAYRMPGTSERQVIESFLDAMPPEGQRAVTFIGHNIDGFDLRFLWQRCVVHGLDGYRLNPSKCRFIDTMQEWVGKYTRGAKGVSLDSLCRALGIKSSKGDITGADVWQAYKDGRHTEIEAYCKDDVRAVVEVYGKMFGA